MATVREILMVAEFW